MFPPSSNSLQSVIENAQEALVVLTEDDLDQEKQKGLGKEGWVSIIAETEGLAILS